MAFIIQFFFVEYKFRVNRVQMSPDISTRLIPPDRATDRTLGERANGRLKEVGRLKECGRNKRKLLKLFHCELM